MKPSLKTHRYLPLAALSSLMLACAAKDPAKQLLGVWVSVDSTTRFEFFDDKRVAFGSSMINAIGSWTILGDGRVKIELAGPRDNSSVLTGLVDSTSLRIADRGDTLRFSRVSAQTDLSMAKERDAQQYIALMKADLRRLMMLQEAHFANFSRYADTIPAEFKASSGVTIQLGSVTQLNWTATARHAKTTHACTITMDGPTTGVPICT